MKKSFISPRSDQKLLYEDYNDFIFWHILVNSSLATARVSLYLSTDLEAGVSEMVEACALQRDEVPAVARQADQGGVSQVDAVGDAEIPSHRNRERLEKCIA